MSTHATPAAPGAPVARPAYGKGWKHWLSTTNHKEVGILYLVTSLFFFVVGGTFALMMRTQLAVAGNTFLDGETYNQMVTMHGIVMIMFFLSPFAFAFGNYFMPIQIGAQDLIFPRLNALSYWMYLAGGLVSLLGFLPFLGGAASGGWTLYTPLSSYDFMPRAGVDLVAIGLVLFVVGVTVSTINFLTTFFMLRAPGLKLYHMPMFSWSIFWTVVIMLFAFPALGAASLMLLVDRQLDFNFFLVQNGGALLWAHLFWFFGHPEVYILLLPGLGAVLEIIPTFSERPMFGKRTVIWALAIATFLSFIVYIHHMFTTGVDPKLRKFMVITTELISVPFGVIYLSLIGTMWKGRIRFEVPMLFAIGFILLFLIGGLTGVFLSSVAIDYGMQGSYWVVAHFHYAVLGGGVWGVIAGLYFWYPKITGKMFSERLGRIHFWTGFIGFNLLFLTMFFYGKMPRRIFTYEENLGYNYAGTEILGRLLPTLVVVAYFAGLAFVLVDAWRSNRTGHWQEIVAGLIGYIGLPLVALAGFFPAYWTFLLALVLPSAALAWGTIRARGDGSSLGLAMGFAGLVGLAFVSYALFLAPAAPGTSELLSSSVGAMTALNTISTTGALMFGLGIILMIVNFVWSIWHGARAGPDPWGGDSLEWTMSSPPPPENFTAPPVLAEHPASKREGGDVGATTTVSGVLKR